jgi:hypothetical protein
MMAAAIFLLLFTAADLAFPDACGEDQQAFGGAAGVRQAGILLSFDQPSSRSTAPVSGDDCFCCCAHVMACQPFVVDPASVTVRAPEIASAAAPAPALQTACEPPRLG